MKATTVFVTLFIIQAKASFLYDFTGALTSVENAVSKLLNDVVTDVETTIHCTILAMEKVLTISGAMKEPSGNNYKCFDNSGISNPYNDKEVLDYLKVDGGNNNEVMDFNKQIKSSISKVNKSLNNILDKGGSKNMLNVKNSHTRRLAEIGILLRQELDKILHRVNDEFHKVDSDKLSIESLWDDMKLLHDVEKNDKNISEVNEISQVLNKAFNVLHLNATTRIKSDEDKMEAIMRELEQESSTNSYNFNIDRELSQWKEKRSEILNYPSHKETPDQIPKSFKEAVSRIFNDQDESRKTTEDIINNLSIESQGKKVSISKSVTTSRERERADDSTKKQEENVVGSDYNSFFSGTAKEDNNKVIDHAKNILKEHDRAKSLFDILAKKDNAAVTNVFDNPDLLDLDNFK